MSIVDNICVDKNEDLLYGNIIRESIASFLRDVSVSYSGQRWASKMTTAFWTHIEINIVV